MSVTTTDSTALAQSLANYLPTGEQWLAKNIEDSDLRLLLESFGLEFARMEDLIDWLIIELNVLETENLIIEWEKAFGIPDECFTIQGKTIAERKKQLEIKIRMNGVQTPEDWVSIADLLDYNVAVYPARELTTFPLVFPIPMIGTEKEQMYTIIVDFIDLIAPAIFPFTFDVTFGAEQGTLIQCVFNKLKPANSTIIYRYLG